MKHPVLLALALHSLLYMQPSGAHPTLNTPASTIFHAARNRTYSVDASCDGRIDEAVWTEIFDPVNGLGARTAARLSDTTDEVALTSFKTLFMNGVDGDPRQSAAFRDVMRINGGQNGTIHGGIKGFTRTADSKKADVRFYCDNDARWRHSQKNETKLVDETNFGLDTAWLSKDGAPACRRPSSSPAVITYSTSVTTKGGDGIAATTVCDLHLNHSSKQTQTLKEVIKQPWFLQGLNSVKDWVHYLTVATSMVIYHEVTHALGTIDIGYDWDLCTSMNSSDAVRNAQSFMYLAGLAMIEDYQYRLDASDPKSGKLMRDNSLVPYNSTSKKLERRRDIRGGAKGVGFVA